MKTLRKVEIEPIYVEYVPEILEPNKLYISETYRTIVHSCLCGCGEKVVTPISQPDDWKLIKHDNDGTKISMVPSIGNYSFDCKSHYIITKNIANFV